MGNKIYKKGLSGIVTIILIILLVLVAVGIIWSAVRGPIEEVGDKIGADCLTLNVEPTSCSFNNQGATVTYDVNFIRNDGAGSLTDVKLIFYDIAGNTKVVDSGVGLGEFETGFKNVDTFSDFTVKYFNVAAVYQPGDTPVACEIPDSRDKIECK